MEEIFFLFMNCLNKNLGNCSFVHQKCKPGINRSYSEVIFLRPRVYRWFNWLHRAHVILTVFCFLIYQLHTIPFTALAYGYLWSWHACCVISSFKEKLFLHDPARHVVSDITERWPYPQSSTLGKTTFIVLSSVSHELADTDTPKGMVYMFLPAFFLHAAFDTKLHEEHLP